MHCDGRSRAPELELDWTHNDMFSNTVAVRPLQMPCARSDSSAGRASLAAWELNTDVCTAQTFKMRICHFPDTGSIVSKARVRWCQRSNDSSYTSSETRVRDLELSLRPPNSPVSNILSGERSDTRMSSTFLHEESQDGSTTHLTHLWNAASTQADFASLQYT